MNDELFPRGVRIDTKQNDRSARLDSALEDVRLSRGRVLQLTDVRPSGIEHSDSQLLRSTCS